MGLNIVDSKLFHSMFTNVFVTFLTFLTFFKIFLNVFLYLWF